MSGTEKTVFKKIIDGELPADVVYEDEHCLAFRDLTPQAPTHILVIPKKMIRNLDDVQEDDQPLMGHLMVVIGKLARQEKLNGGYRVISNCGVDGGQSVDHLHFHLLAGRALEWPPG